MEIKELKNLLIHPKTLLTHPKVVSAYVDTSLVLLNKFTGYVSKFMRHLIVVQGKNPNTIPGQQNLLNLESALSAGAAPLNYERKTKDKSLFNSYGKKVRKSNSFYEKPFAKWDTRTRTWTSCSDPIMTSKNHDDLVKIVPSEAQKLISDIHTISKTIDLETISEPLTAYSLLKTLKDISVATESNLELLEPSEKIVNQPEIVEKLTAAKKKVSKPKKTKTKKAKKAAKGKK